MVVRTTGELEHEIRDVGGGVDRRGACLERRAHAGNAPARECGESVLAQRQASTSADSASVCARRISIPDSRTKRRAPLGRSGSYLSRWDHSASRDVKGCSITREALWPRSRQQS